MNPGSRTRTHTHTHTFLYTVCVKWTLSDLARVCRSILYVLMKPISSNMLRTHCRETKHARDTGVVRQFP